MDHSITHMPGADDVVEKHFDAPDGTPPIPRITIRDSKTYQTVVIQFHDYDTARHVLHQLAVKSTELIGEIGLHQISEHAKGITT